MASTPCPPLKTVVELFNALNAQGINYCHWKSNCHLDRALGGQTDLDLLVASDQTERFKLVLRQHDVKPVISPPDKQYPAVEDYLGFDPNTGRLFHLHVHYQLVLGEQFVKNYRLPLEQAFLEHVQIYQGLIKIPLPELELIVLAIRALLKYRDRDVVKDTLSIRSPGLPPNILREFKYLLEQTDQEKVAKALQAHAGFISPEIVLEMLATVANAPRSGRVLYRLRRDLRRELAAYQRDSRWRAMGKYFKTLSQRRFSFLASSPSKKVPASGGRVVAVIGADGAGKSTLVKALRAWLAWKLEVRNHYMGSQERSPLSQLSRWCYRGTRKMARMWNELTNEKQSNRVLKRLRGIFHDLYFLSTARDRYRRYVAGKRQAAAGAIVICDRYPLVAIHQKMKDRPMDGPRIAADAGNDVDRLTKRWAQIEQNIYDKIQPPDHVFVLHVSPDVSQRRKPEHNLKMIENKSYALKHMDTQGLHTTDIDADLPYEQVLLEIKKRLWQLL